MQNALYQCCHHAGGCNIGGCTCNHDIRYLMFNTITAAAAAATAMVIMVVLVVIMVAGTDNDYA